MKIKLDGATMMDEWSSMTANTPEPHYGHICRAQVKLTGVTIIDERDAQHEERNLRDEEGPEEKKAEVAKLLAGRSVTFPNKLEVGEVVHGGCRDGRR